MRRYVLTLLLASVLVAVPAGEGSPTTGFSDGTSFPALLPRVATDDLSIVVGMPYDDAGGRHRGAVLVLSWTPSGFDRTTLVASDGANDDLFGAAVAIDGDRIVVGSYRDDDRGTKSGSAYVFEYLGSAGWEETAKLVPSTISARDEFGYSVAISGDRVVVGAPQANPLGIRSGAAYVFDVDGSGRWTERRLLAPDGMAGDHFGHSVAASGNRVFVGAPRHDGAGDDAGAIYVFGGADPADRTVTKVTASDAAPSSLFGTAVAAAGPSVVVGAPWDTWAFLCNQWPPRPPHDTDHPGRVYLLDADARAGWSERVITASDGGRCDAFGASVAISGQRVLVGAPEDDNLGDHAGSLYLFEPDGTGDWTQTNVVDPEAGPGAGNGFTVALSDRWVIGSGVSGARVYEPPIWSCGGLAATIVGTGKSDDIVGTDGPDVIVGLWRSDTIDGRGGDDVICGGGGNDRIMGGDGNDTIYGEAGSDRIWGGNGNDTVWGGDGRDRINGQEGDDILWGENGDDVVHGRAGDDLIHGGSGSDRIWGERDHDTSWGDDGDDLLKAGPGNDTSHGGAGNDIIFGQAGADLLYGEGGDDLIIAGTGSDTAVGGAGADTIEGRAHRDLLRGGSGDDLLLGGTWPDVLDGGDGADDLDGGRGIDTCTWGEVLTRCEVLEPVFS